MYMSVCKTAESKGVKVIHGNRGVFHKDKQPAFKAIYQAWKEVGGIIFHSIYNLLLFNPFELNFNVILDYTILIICLGVEV